MLEALITPDILKEGYSVTLEPTSPVQSDQPILILNPNEYTI